MKNTTTFDFNDVQTFDVIERIIALDEARSAWDRGVKEYAYDLLHELREAVECGWVDADDLCNPRLLEKAMLNGARSWREFSEGGCSLIYDCDIAERLSTPSELLKTHGGLEAPNRSESWIDVQSRALFQACDMILRVVF